MRQPRVPKGAPDGGQFAETNRPSSTQVLTQHHDWNEVGVQDPDKQTELEEAGVSPCDFFSPNRDRRMWACHSRGDIIFEGELLSNGHMLHNYEPTLGTARTFHHPYAVELGDRTVRWSDMPAEEQADHIAGYAAAAAGKHMDSRSLAWEAGYRRALRVETIARRLVLSPGRITEVEVVAADADNRSVRLMDPRPDELLRRGFVGEVAPKQYRRHYSADESSRSVERTPGTHFHFDMDAILR